MAHEVVAEVHAHEPGKLEEARIDPPPAAAILHRHRRDHVVPEPLDRALHREVVDRGRRAAGVDRAAHHRQRRRAGGVTPGVHHRRRGERGDRRLAHRDHVRIGPDEGEELNQVIDVVVEVEAPRAHRHVARVGPVGDEHLARFHDALDRAAQQRGIVTAHRRDDQHSGRVYGQALAGEAAQVAERLVVHDRLGHRVRLARNRDRFDAEGGLAARLCGVGEDFERARGDRGHPEIGQRVARVGQHFGGDRGPRACSPEPGALQFVSVVEQ